MTVLLRIVGGANGAPCPEAGCYVRRYSADGYGGRGCLLLTPQVEHAHHYPSFIDALEEWRRVSATHPVRKDGKPNRPLSAFTVTIEPAP